MRAGDRQLELRVLDTEAARLGARLDVQSPHLRALRKAEAQRPSGERVERFIVTHDEHLARAGAQRGEHRRNVVHLLVIALQVKDHANGWRVAHQ